MKVSNWRVFDWFIVIAVVFAIVIAFAPAANAAKNCSLDGTAGLSPEYGQTIVDNGSISPGDTLASMGESNTRQIFAKVSSNLNLVNSATGGCTIGSYARSSSKCWGNMPKSADVVWMKPINRSQGIDPNVYMAALEQDIVGALGEINDRMTGVKEVWLSAHHATPYADDRIDRNGVLKPPKQEEPYSHDAVFPIQNVVAKYQGAYPFRLVNSAYLWANANKARADGLQWVCGDFSDDGVHLSSGGNNKAAREVEAFIANAMGAAPPPPDPDPDPPPTGGVCEPDPQYPAQECSTTFRPGFCACKNPWRKTPL